MIHTCTGILLSLRTTKALSGAGTGTVIGTMIGATAGIITDIGVSIVIHGIGLFLTGQIGAALAGAGAGGITG